MKISDSSVQLKIIALIILILMVAITSIVYVTIQNQKRDLLEAAENTLAVNTDILNNTIKSIMISGEAPIAVRTMGNIKGIPELQEVEIYRTSGDVAFSDYETLNFVNEYQNNIMFDKTTRSPRSMADNDDFKKILEDGRKITNVLKETGEMEYYFAISNEKECWDCHSPSSESHHLRGIAYFKISIQGIYDKIKMSQLFLIILFAVTGILLAVILIFFMRRIIVKPLQVISNTVTQFGEGDLSVQVNLDHKDEFGTLGDQLNHMFVRIKERIELSKFVSKSTNDMITRGHGGQEGENKIVTALFSDIRGFTLYADNHTPDEVVKNLNRILNVQAEIVEIYGGDVDKFVGDEVMAIFSNPVMAIKAAYEMIKEVKKLNEDSEDPLYVGIGLNTGEVISGNIGSENRKEFAVIGDTINLASRLCSAAKPNMILVSDSTYALVEDVINAKIVKNQTIKGKRGGVNFYIVQSLK